MKLTLSCLRQAIAVTAICCASTAPLISVAADRPNPTPRYAPLGTPVQQVNYRNYTNNYSGNGSCPDGNCQTGGGMWGRGNGLGLRGWGGGACSSCGLFGCQGCLHGLAQGNAFVRPPAVWPVARTPNTYQHYWAPQLMGVQPPAVAYPMIYHPTDTTQLGFSYQHVPRWGYRTDMLPPAPVPNWPLGLHTAYGNGFGGGFGGNCPNCDYGPGIVTSTPNTTTTPNNVVQSPVDVASPVTPAPIPLDTNTPAQGGVVVPSPPVDSDSAFFPNDDQ